MRKINDVLKRTTATVLSVALILAICFPVPYMSAHDRLRIERAYANPAVLAGGVGAYVVGTMLVYCGLYIAGNTAAEYNANLDDVYDAYCDYLIDNLEVTRNDIDTICAQAYDPNQNTINFDTLAAAGFIGALPLFAQSLMSGGEAVEGLSSISSNQFVMYFGDNAFKSTSVHNEAVSYVEANTNWIPFAYQVGEDSTYNYVDVYVVNSGRYPVLCRLDGTKLVVLDTWETQRYKVKKSNGSVTLGYGVENSSRNGTLVIQNIGYSGAGTYHPDLYLLSDAEYNLTTSGASISEGNISSSSAVIDTNAINTRVNELLQTAGTVVQGFEPTAAQLESGYTFEDVVTAGIDEVNVNLGTISTGIAALDTVLNSILGVVSGIATNVLNIWNTLSGLAQDPFAWLASWWQSLTGWWAELLQWIRATPLGTFCADVTSWLGATPIGTLIGEVVSAIPGVGTIEQTLSGVLDGVLDIPDAISGVLDGTLSIPDAIADVLSDVFGLDFAGTLEGVLEGVFFPNIILPTLSVNPTYADAVTFEGVLQDKAPFAYMFAFKNAVDGAAETYSNNASFRIRHYFDLAGEDVLFDINAEPYLNRDVGGVTIAQLLRASVTLTLCMGLLYAAYKTGIAAVGSREG